MRTCETCKYLIYPTMVGYACKKRGLWGTDIPLFFDRCECKKWKLTNRKDDANGKFKKVEPFQAGVYYTTKHHTLYYEGEMNDYSEN